jgi:hypothetical protein
MFSSMAQQLLVGQIFLIIESLQAQLDTPHLVGLPWMSDQPEGEWWRIIM